MNWRRHHYTSQGSASPGSQVDYPVSFNWLAQHPCETARRLATAVGRKYIEWDRGAVVLRHYSRGALLCHQGEYASTFFVILEGSVEVMVLPDMGTVPFAGRSRPGSRFLRILAGRTPKRPGGIPPGSYQVATLGEGEIVGELACLSFQPRSAAVRSTESCTALEVSRSVLDHVRGSVLGDEWRRTYDHRATSSCMRRSELLGPFRSEPARLERVVAGLLSRGVRLVRYGPEQVILRQGEPADDGFYVVHLGHVKVSRRRRGGEATVGCLGPGAYFGEVALLSALLEARSPDLPDARTATCTALGRVELLQVPPIGLLELPREIRQPIIETALGRLMQN